MLLKIMIRIWGYVAIIGAALLTAATFGKSQQRKGADKYEKRATEADHENANDIRARVSNSDKRMRDYDDAGFRD